MTELPIDPRTSSAPPPRRGPAGRPARASAGPSGRAPVPDGIVAALIVEVYPGVDRVDAERVSTTLARSAISHVILPTDAPATAAAAVVRVLRPLVAEVFGLPEAGPSRAPEAGA